MAIDKFRQADIVLYSANGYIFDEQFGKVGDVNGRELVVQVTNRGVVENQANLTLTLSWKHEQNGNEGLNQFTAITPGQGVFSVALDQNMMQAGSVLCTIQIFDQGNLTNSRNFKIRVEKNALNVEGATSSDSFTAFIEAFKKIGDLNKYQQQVTEHISNIKNPHEVTAEQVGSMTADNIKTAINGMGATKRDKSALLKSSDFSVSNDADKIQPENLSAKVLAMMTGDTPISPTIPDNSIVEEKLTANSVGTRVITKYLLPGYIVASKYGLPNYDPATGILDFKSHTDNTAILRYSYITYQIPAGTTVVNTLSTTAVILTFDTVNQVFRFIEWGTGAGVNDLILAVIRTGVDGIASVSANFPIMIGGAKIYGKTDELPVTLVHGDNGLPILDKKAGTLTFPPTKHSYVGYDIYVGDVLYQQFIKSDGLVFKFPSKEELSTGSQLLMFDTIKHDLFVCGYDELGTYGAYSALLGTIRTVDTRDDFQVNLNFEYVVPEDVEPPKPTINSIDANVLGICHRGFNTIAPEESRAAYALALENGYYHWEGDIQFTKDSIPVMSHDDTVNRIARNMDGSVITDTVKFADQTYEALNIYDWGVYKGDEYKGTSLLKLEELIILARKLNARLHLEIKSKYTDEQYKVLFDLFNKYRAWNITGFQSFDVNWFTPLLALKPGLNLEPLFGKRFTAVTALKTPENKVVTSIENTFTNADVDRISTAADALKQ